MFKTLAFLTTLATLCRAANCRPIPGTGQLFGPEGGRPGIRFVVIGEMHGTNETPAIFADMVCAASQKSQRPAAVIVGVELNDQAAIDRFLKTGRVIDLLQSPDWREGNDGRTSSAMLRLLKDLRALRRRHAIAEVVAFSQTRREESDGQREQSMAQSLLEAAQRRPGSILISLTGNLHGAKQPIPDIAPYPLMASFLPPKETISLLLADLGGEAWTCEGDGCKLHRFGSTLGANREVELKPQRSPLPGYDGVLSTGLAATASEPAFVGRYRPSSGGRATQRTRSK